MDEDNRSRPVGRSLYDSDSSGIADRVTVHRREQTEPGQITCKGGGDTLHGAILRGIAKKVPEESIRMGLNRSSDRILIAGNARDERRSLDAVAIKLGDPAAGEDSGIGIRRLPPDNGGNVGGCIAGLLCQCTEKLRRKKMHVRVSDAQIAPRSVHPFYRGVSGSVAIGKRVRPAESAS